MCIKPWTLNSYVKEAEDSQSCLFLDNTCPTTSLLTPWLVKAFTCSSLPSPGSEGCPASAPLATGPLHHTDPASPKLFAATSNKSQCTNHKGWHRAYCQFIFEKQIHLWDLPPRPHICLESALEFRSRAESFRSRRATFLSLANAFYLAINK